MVAFRESARDIKKPDAVQYIRKSNAWCSVQVQKVLAEFKTMWENTRELGPAGALCHELKAQVSSTDTASLLLEAAEGAEEILHELHLYCCTCSGSAGLAAGKEG